MTRLGSSVSAMIAGITMMGLFGGAFAGDFKDRCVAISLNDTLPSDLSEADVHAVCSCLAEMAQADPAVMDALEPGLDIADFEARMEAAGAAGQDAISACS